MDNPVILLLLLLLIVIFIIAKTSSSPQSKGTAGERKVACILGDTIPGTQYVINDVILPTQTGDTCQIDHIFINRYGIWVIETKNYAGRIYGQENALEWTQVLAYGKTKNKFYNPIKQNTSHIYHLTQALNLPFESFHNIVVFTNRAELFIDSTHVFTEKNLKTIKQTPSNVSLSAENMQQYYKTLVAIKNTNIERSQEHVKNVQQRQANIQQGICPRCNGKLVVRNGKNGKFYGCSNYPKCKFTKKL